MTVSGGIPGGQDVADALNDVVVDLGRPAAFDPVHLRQALVEALTARLSGTVGRDGARAAATPAQLPAPFHPLVDAIVIAAEEGVPDGMLEDVPAIDLGDLLEAREMPAELMGWVLHAWGVAVRLAEPSPTTPIRTGSDVPDFPAFPTFADGPAFPDFPAEYPIDFRTRKPSRRRGPLIALVVMLVLVVVGIGAGFVLGSGNAVGEKDGTRGAGQAAATPPPAPDVPALLAYRGGSETFPPDTLPAILDSAEAGAGVEVDLRWTSDGVPVLMRNARVQPPMYCAQRYAVAGTTWKVLASCLTQASVSGDGKSYGIVRLDTALEALATVKGAEVYLEIKIDQTDEQDRRLLTELKSAGMTGRTVVGSLLPDELAQLRKAGTASGTPVRLMQFVRDRKLTPAAAKGAGLWAVALKQSALDRKYVGQLRAAGLKVGAWTPNDAGEWAEARKAGVDFLETEKPGAYAKWAKAR